jgi:uncharacterized Tic20 family protein
MNLQDEKNWGIFISLSGIVGLSLLPPVGNIIAPLVLWLIKRNESTFVDQEGKEALNFQITISVIKVALNIITSIYYGVWSLNSMLWHGYASPGWHFGVGTSWSTLLWLVNVIFSIIAVTKANNLQVYRYPISLRLVK